jgi:hypothetical protein
MVLPVLIWLRTGSTGELLWPWQWTVKFRKSIKKFLSDWWSVVRVPGYRSRGPGFEFRHYQIFWEVVGLERGPLSLVSTTEELLGRKSNGSDLENQEYDRMDPLYWPRYTLYPQKLALTSPTSGGRSVDIVRLRTKGHGVFFWRWTWQFIHPHQYY